MSYVLVKTLCFKKKKKRKQKKKPLSLLQISFQFVGSQSVSDGDWGPESHVPPSHPRLRSNPGTLHPSECPWLLGPPSPVTFPGDTVSTVFSGAEPEKIQSRWTRPWQTRKEKKQPHASCGPHGRAHFRPWRSLVVRVESGLPEPDSDIYRGF